MNEAKDLVRTIFLGALEIEDPERRSAFLAQACGTDSRLRQEVEELLAAGAAAGRFLPERPGRSEGRGTGVEAKVGEARGEGSTEANAPGSATAMWIPVTEKPGDR